MVEALRAIKVPNIRWPGGCYADKYHWRDGIGPRPAAVQDPEPRLGGVIEPNSFGTHEFMDLAEQVGAEAYVSINVGSGSVREMAEWLEYMTSAKPSSLAQERVRNGAAKSFSKVPLLGIGNEVWGCGGSMTPEGVRGRDEEVRQLRRQLPPRPAEGGPEDAPASPPAPTATITASPRW